MYKEVLCESFIEKYKSYHMILFRELNIMLFDVAFLKECISHSGRILDTDIVISYLFKNNYEHLILKTYRIIFDNGLDVLTLDSFIGQVIKNSKNEEVKENLCNKVSGLQWKSDHIKAVKSRLKESLGEFRNKAIAHKLTQQMKDLSVDLEDISELLDAAIDLFEEFSFYPLDFYPYRITEYSFVAERLTVQEKSKQILDLLLFSSKDIRHIDVQLRDMMENSHKEEIENFVSQYNFEREEDDICTKLLLNSKISTFTKSTLLQMDEFRKELLKYETVSDTEVLDMIYNLRQQLVNEANEDKIKSYRLSILDTCIENVKKIVACS